ncbi:MAG: GNAT family N-acetyltransferase [ANME-2 cluster archaeon]|nr:GNAT family N-acetyltransferase [ANME-2 cluster archaeon]MBC2700520.1 GNAT family N-acetyltransferase [ANME-2 cluster archaeon]MBC2706536.1 GNAT family N-acetyltransferase [ANME-2 cluster archaeon]MBC2746640.1 GNAT family N-acetyltransferase [ANME-2 cluster archaeon]
MFVDVLAAAGLALSVSEIIGCRYLTVDSKPESMSFYERLGFRVVERYRQTDFPGMLICNLLWKGCSRKNLLRILWGDVGVSQVCGFNEELIIEHPQLSIDMHPPH